MAIYLEYMGYSVEVPRGETVIGRDVTCGLRFNDSATSRRHLRIVREDNHVEIEDLGSTNGTFLNGDPLSTKTRLADRDLIEIATHRLRFCVTDEGDPDVATRKLASLSDLNTMRKPRLAPAARHTGPVVIIPPKPERETCPRCGASVGAADRACATCNYQWGVSRPRSPTVATPNVPAIERRREERRPIELSLIYSSSELEIEAMTRDLSSSGVFVCSQVLEPLSTVCELTILLDGAPPLQIRGIVRRVVEREELGGEPVGLGIEFVEVGEAERSWLDMVLDGMSVTEDHLRMSPTPK